MTAKCVDAPPSPAPRTVVCLYTGTTRVFSLLRHCLQNLVQYFKLTYVFSISLKFFVRDRP